MSKSHHCFCICSFLGLSLILRLAASPCMTRILGTTSTAQHRTRTNSTTKHMCYSPVRSVTACSVPNEAHALSERLHEHMTTRRWRCISRRRRDGTKTPESDPVAARCFVFIFQLATACARHRIPLVGWRNQMVLHGVLPLLYPWPNTTIPCPTAALVAFKKILPRILLGYIGREPRSHGDILHGQIRRLLVHTV